MNRLMSDPSLPVRCQCRRKAVTGLRCSRCDVPICPDCSGSATVGFLCRTCLRGARSPLFQVNLGSLVLAYALCLPLAAFCGWLIVSIATGIGFFGLMIAFFYGVGMGEVALRATGRKRGLQVEILAGVSAAFGMLAGLAILYLARQGMSRMHLPLGFLLLNPFFFADLIVGVVGAVNRVRNI